MTGPDYLSDKISKVLLSMLVAIMINVSVDAQGIVSENMNMIPGESVSPALSGKVLELLFDGVADLFYSSENKTGFFYITDSHGRLFTLKIPPKQKDEGSEDAKSEYEGIISILKTVMHDAPQLQERIESIVPVKQELVSLMHDFHVALTGSDDGIKYEVPPPVLVPHIGIYAGYNADFLKPGSSDDIYGFNLDPGFYPSAGISLSLQLPRISPDLSLNIDVSAAKRYIYGYNNIINTSLPVTDVFYELHLHNYLIDFNIMPRYCIHPGNMDTYISGGICTRTILTDDSRIDTDVCYDGLVVSDSYDYDSEEKTSMGIIFSLGFSFEIIKNISVTAAVNYSEYLITPVYSGYRTAGLTLGANF